VMPMKRRGGGELQGALIVLLLLAGVYYFFVYNQGNNMMSVDMTLYYADGTSRLYNLVIPVLGQAVIDPSNGKTLTNIAWTVKAASTWTGSASKLEVTGSNTLYVISGSATTLKATYPISYSTTTGLGSLGQATFSVYQGTLQASLLESWDTGQLNPTKTLRFMIDTTGKLTMTDSNILPSSKTAGAQVDLQYRVDPDGLKALTISITVSST
jgi:hypothetical protein